MKIVLMAAVSPDRVIGRNGKIPWHYPNDMKFVMETTVGHPCVMGRKTYETLPHRPLPRRTNIVLTSQSNYDVRQGIIVCTTFEGARRYCEDSGADCMFVLGGERVYYEALPHGDELLITHVPDRVQGDVYFPEWNEEEWSLATSRDEGGLRFATYVHKST